MDPATAGSLWKSRYSELFEDIVDAAGDPADIVEGHVGHRVEVNAQFVGAIEIGVAHRPRVEIDTAQVDGPNNVRHVKGAELLGRTARGKVHSRGVEPVGPRGGDALLEKHFPVDPVGKTLEDGWPPVNTSERPFADRNVVLDELHFRYWDIREKHLAGP